MRTLFVTASGTGVGKTLVTRLLCRQTAARGIAVRAVKPVISGYAEGEDTDTRHLLEAQGLPVTPETIERVSPWRFQAPMSPDMAARREGRAIDFAALLKFCRDCRSGSEDGLVIEGIGGVMVPLGEDRTVLDWIAALGEPALMVAGSYLGGLSHALTAIEALRSRAVPILALMVSESEESPAPLPEIVGTLARFAHPVPVLALPRLGNLDAAPDLALAMNFL